MRFNRYDDLTIDFGSGYLTIFKNNFFPCSQERMRVLVKFIKEDCEHRDELFTDLRRFFQRKISICDGKIEFATVLPDPKLLKQQTAERKRWIRLLGMLPKKEAQ